MTAQVLKPEEYFITEQPYYEPVGNEILVFEAAYRNQLPVLLKGPTGCGKTRFMEHMAWRLKRPLITVSCHDDLTASDLVGRFLISGGETVWVDGPLARAVRSGGICYLDEVVEARKDTTVVIHPLADDRRLLPMDAPEDSRRPVEVRRSTTTRRDCTSLRAAIVKNPIDTGRATADVTIDVRLIQDRLQLLCCPYHLNPGDAPIAVASKP